MNNFARCGTDLDHGVLVVGYGIENMTEYWLLKNSWGAGWGEKGFFKLARVMNPSKREERDGMCGVNMQPVKPNE